MKYLLLIYSEESQWANMSEAEQGQVFGEYMTYTNDIHKSGHYVSGEALQPTATPLGAVAAGVVHQDLAHRSCCHGEEVPPVPPFDPALIDQLEVGLVHQARGAEGVTGPLALELPVGDPAQLRINQREEAVHRLRSTLTDLEEEVSDRLASAVGRRIGGCHCPVAERRSVARIHCGR